MHVGAQAGCPASLRSSRERCWSSVASRARWPRPAGCRRRRPLHEVAGPAPTRYARIAPRAARAITSSRDGADRIVLRHAGADAVVSVPGPSVRNAVARFRFRLSSVPTGDGVSVAAVFRRRPGNQYRVTVRVASDGTVWLSAMRVRLGITRPIGAEVPVLGLQITPGASLSVRAAVTGNRAVTLRARVWPTGSAEPHGWQLMRRGHGASLKAPGRVGLRVSLSSNATRVPVEVAVDGMQVSRISNPIGRADSGATRGATGKPRKGPRHQPSQGHAPERDERDHQLDPGSAVDRPGAIWPEQALRRQVESRTVVPPHQTLDTDRPRTRYALPLPGPLHRPRRQGDDLR